MDLSYKAIWLGSPKSMAFGDWEKGNTVLIQTGATKYVLVCRDTVEEFSIDGGDLILDFFNPIGNNDVPYPYIVGKKNVYILLESVSVPKEALDLSADVYGQWYGGAAELKKMAKKIVGKTLHSI